jgi:putative Mg2+ transporter-C (MgtC) family protein
VVSVLAFLDPIRDLTDWAVVLRMLLSAAAGGAIGLEREFRRRPAGFRTHILICLGACITTMTSQYLLLRMHYYTDITRLGAQVIAGIGFVGAGAIMVTRRRQVKGLTTAAGLWVSAIIGLSFGAGFYEGGAYAAMLLLLAELLLTRFEYRSLRYISRQSICIEYEARCQLDDFLSMLERNRIRLSHLEINRSGSSYCAIAAIRLPKGADAETLAAKAADIHGILRVYLL